MFQRRAKFLDYERKVFKPPETSTGSSVYPIGPDDLSDISVVTYNYPDRRQKLPHVKYDIIYDVTNSGLYPFFIQDRKWNTRQPVILSDNTYLVPYESKYRTDARYISGLSLAETDVESNFDDGWQVITNFRPALPRYIND